ncbi:MAG: metal-dependent hydrolase [Rhodopirellula sp.]|nr:metal-dependent hydrolase [Rhodopirellula sp.]OUX50964.1 MAG: hypothetical protein CBE43_04870 [Rhodopirellula sp. TMED283]
MTFHRRELIHGALAAGTASMVAASEREKLATMPAPPSINHPLSMPSRVIDTNVSLFHWPFRRLPLDEVNKLCAKFQQLGITEVWAGSFEALLHRDLRTVNERLLRACQNRGELIPVGAVNPTFPDWKHDLNLCLGRFGMPGVRLLPGYHGYALGDAVFGELLETATKLGGFVQVVIAMEDTRTQSNSIQAPNVDPRPLQHWMQQIPEARVQILNCRPSASDLRTFASIHRLAVDTSRVDGTDGVSTLVKAIGIDRVLYGSHSPFLIPEAACIRMIETDIPGAEVKAIMQENAEHFRNSKSTSRQNQQKQGQ